MAVRAVRVRRRALLTAAAALGLGLAIAVIGPENPASSVPALPQGWRWESFGGVQVGVPGDWGWGNGAQRVDQWCVEMRNGTPPIVGRPRSHTMAGCGFESKESPRPETLLTNTGQLVAFQPTRPNPDGGTVGDSTRTEGDSLLMTRSGIQLQIVAKPALRRQIAATVHLVDLDVNGCPTTDPISLDPSRRPAAASSVKSLGDVLSISICQYPLAGKPTYVEPELEARLIASAILSGDEARAAVGGIDNTPTGSGPNRPWECMDEYQYGDEVIVLRIHRARGESQVYLRFDGCDHHGFDDGTTVHRLTSTTVANFLVAGVVINSYTSELADTFEIR